jgi:putative alpha-1,2-mannosidase
MDKYFALLFCIAAFSCKQKSSSLLQQVDPFLGTGGHGHVHPAATIPFGMVQLGPDNGVDGWDWCSGYNYSSNTIAGFISVEPALGMGMTYRSCHKPMLIACWKKGSMSPFNTKTNLHHRDTMQCNWTMACLVK